MFKFLHTHLGGKHKTLEDELVAALTAMRGLYVLEGNTTHCKSAGSTVERACALADKALNRAQNERPESK